MKNNSIKKRLLRILLIPMLSGLLVVGVASFFSTRHEAEEIYDAQMSHFAIMLELLAAREVNIETKITSKLNIQYYISGESYIKNFAYRVWYNKKNIIKSTNSNKFAHYPTKTGFSDLDINNKLWRVLVLNNGPLTIEVAQDYDARNDLINKILVSIFVPMALLVPIIILVIIYGIRIGLKPLEYLSNAVASRSIKDLSPISIENTPSEAIPLVKSLNILMDKIRDAFEKEKRFTSYAAHELRTPLAALKAQIQVALRHKDLEKQKEMFIEATYGVDRMSHLVEQLLTLMRVQQNEIEKEKTNVSELLFKIAKGFDGKANEKFLKLELNITRDIVHFANNEMLEIMFSNLISNAIKYSEQKGDIILKLHNIGENLEFEISNPTKEISKEALEKIFEPFYRLQGEKEMGAGIGLSIVKWIVEAHKGSVKAFTSQGNFIVRVVI